MAIFAPTPAFPPVTDSYIAGLLDTSLKVDIFKTGIRVAISSPYIETINVTRSFFKTTHENVTFAPNRPTKVTVFLENSEQRRALEIARSKGIVTRQVAECALKIMDALAANPEADTTAAREELKAAIAATRKGSPSEADIEAAPEVSAEYAAAVADQRAMTVPAKPVLPRESKDPITGENVKPKKPSKKKEPTGRYGKVNIFLNKPGGVIAEAIRKTFGGVTKSTAPHRLTITHDKAERWLDDVLPELRIQASTFDSIRVPKVFSEEEIAEAVAKAKAKVDRAKKAEPEPTSAPKTKVAVKEEKAPVTKKAAKPVKK